MAVEIDALQIEIQASSNQAVSGIEKLAASLDRLKGAAKGGAGLTSMTNQITKLAAASKALSSVNLGGGKIEQLSNALNSLSSIQKATGLTSTINALNKLPKITESLKATDLGEFANQMTRVANAVRPLATEMQKVSAGFAAFPIRIQKIIASNAGLTASNKKAANSFNLFGSNLTSALGKMTLWGFSLKQVANVMAGWVTRSNDYVENLNLFTVAMGDGAEEALHYAEEVQKALGIDMSEFIRNQGMFKQITSGFGVAAEKANLMSKNLTTLGYDISSLYNISIQEAMEKLQSGISGEIEPLRRLGYAIDVATLEQVALNHGIDENINTMSQAQKSQLRYVAIMEQSKNAMGDMARTLDSPANAMRILNQQLEQFYRALGNMMIPILIEIMPYVQAFVEVLTEASQKFALLLGFSLPEFDYSGLDGLENSTGEAGENLEDAKETAKELKRTLTAFDELNILGSSLKKEDDKDKDKNDLGIKLPEYKFFDEMKKRTDEIKKQMQEVLDVTLLIGAAFLTWEAAKALSQVSTLLKNLKTLQKLAASAILLALEFQLVSQSYDDFLSSNGSVWDLLKAGIIAGIGSWALYAMWGPAGLAIGIGVAAVAVLTSLAGALASGSLKVDDFKTWLTAAIVSALGALAGFAVVKAFPGLGIAGATGAAIGLMIGAAVALSVINVSAVLGGQINALGVESTIFSIVSSIFAGIAGATIATSLGIATAGVGFAVGFGIALVLNIIAVSIANEVAQAELRKQLIDNVIFDEQGVAIEDLTDKYIQLAESISGSYEKFGKLGESVSLAKDKVKEATSSLSNFAFGIESGLYTVEEVLPKIEQSFSTFKDNVSQILDGTYEIIVGALAGSVGDAVVSAGGSLDEYAQVIAKTKGNIQTEMLDIVNEFDKLIEQKDKNIISDKEFDVSFTALMQKIQSFTLTDVQNALNGLDVSLDSLTDINYTNIDVASQAFSNAGEKIQTAKDKITEGAQAQREALETLKLGASPEDIKVFDSLISAVDKALQTDLAKVDQLVVKYTSQIQGNVIQETQKVYDEAMSNWNSLDWFSKTFTYGGEQEQYVQKVIEDYKTNTIMPLTEGMREAFSTSLTDDNLWAAEAIDTMVSNLFTTIVHTSASGNFETYSKEFSGNIKSEIDNALSKAGFDESGKYIADTIAYAITDNLNGMTIDVSLQVDTDWSSSAKQSITAPKSSRNYMQSSFSSIPRFATGGFPKQGQMFIANEAGPELVANIGRKTAVANNDQIVTGISDGVAEANTEVINAIYAGVSMLVKAVQDSKTDVYLDRDKISRAAYEDSQRLGKIYGKSLVNGVR